MQAHLLILCEYLSREIQSNSFIIVSDEYCYFVSDECFFFILIKKTTYPPPLPTGFRRLLHLLTRTLSIILLVTLMHLKMLVKEAWYIVYIPGKPTMSHDCAIVKR